MNRIPRATLIALSCTMLSWLGSVQGQGSDVTPPDNSVHTLNSTTESSDEKGGTPFERWKSCAALIHPDGGYSVSDLQASFEQPKSIPELLQNLKLAWHRNLLLQPSFYDPAVLRRFFDGSQVKQAKSDSIVSYSSVKLEVNDLGDYTSQKMSVSLESRCRVTVSKAEHNRSLTTTTISSFLHIEVEPNPTLTLSVVRSVFGHEASSSLDRGVDPHGYMYTPTDDGRLVYRNIEKEKLEGSIIETVFYFKLPGETVNESAVTRVEMHETQHRVLRIP